MEKGGGGRSCNHASGLTIALNATAATRRSSAGPAAQVLDDPVVDGSQPCESRHTGRIHRARHEGRRDDRAHEGDVSPATSEAFNGGADYLGDCRAFGARCGLRFFKHASIQPECSLDWVLKRLRSSSSYSSSAFR